MPRVDLGGLHPPRVLTAPSPAQLLSYRNLNDDTIPQVGALQVTANIVFGYATWVPFPPPWCCPRLPHSRASGTHPAWVWSGAGAQPRLYHILLRAASSPWSMLEVLGVAAPSPLQGWGMLAALLSSGQCPRGSKHRGSSGIWAEDALNIQDLATALWLSFPRAQWGLEGSHGWSPSLPHPRRCADAEAYELSQGELSNGVFVSFLKRWLLDDEKITVLLDKVAEGEWRAAGTPGDGSVPHRRPLSLSSPRRHGHPGDHAGPPGAGAPQQPLGEESADGPHPRPGPGRDLRQEPAVGQGPW